MKISKRIVVSIFAICLPLAIANAQIKDADFEAAMKKYLESSSGQEAVGQAAETYFRNQQETARKKQEEMEASQLEEQFKNPVKIDIGNSPVKGPKDAKVTIIEFSDFECPYCKRGKDTMDQLLAKYPKDVKVVFKNLPLSFHQNARPAAKAALAAGKQGKFWEMHDALFNNARNLNQELYEATAKELKLDVAKFKKDMESDEIEKQIKSDEEQAAKNGIQGTPGFFVNGVAVRGAYPVEHFSQIIDRWLKK